MPYKSERQRRFFHTRAARRQGISEEMVREWDEKSKGKKLPERANKHFWKQRAKERASK